MTGTDSDDEPVPGGYVHARSAMAHLQQAATEMISAAHAALDALDEAVREPVDFGDLISRAAQLAQVLAERAWGGATGGRPGPPDGDNPVEHIPVS